MMRTFGVIVFLLGIGNVYAQKADLRIADKYSNENLGKYVQNTQISPNWIDNSGLFHYTVTTREGTNYYLVNPTRKEKVIMFNSREMAGKLTALTSQLYEANNLKMYSITFSAKEPDHFTFESSRKRFSYNIRTKVLKEIPKEEPVKTQTRPSFQPSWKKFSPDSAWFVYAYKHDLYLQKSDEDTSTRLTFDGAPYYSFIGANSATTDEKKYSASVYWLKNSRQLVAVREDKRAVGEMSIINSLSLPRPTVSTYKFPIPGDADVVQYELFTFDVSQRKARKINIAKYPDQRIILQSTLNNGKTVLYAPQIINSDRYVYFLRRNRTNDQMDLCRLDANTGEVFEVITETCAPHFNDQLFTCNILNDGKDILWWSERTGYGQYYRYDNQGNFKNAITTGLFVAGDIHTIDTAGHALIIEGYGREKGIDPYYRMYYKVKFDGTGFTLLTPGNGYHDISLSKDKRYLLDTYSRMDMAPVNIVRNMAGRQLLELEQTDLTALSQTGWKKPQLLKIKAADGVTDLYGVMYLPFNLDSTKKYPIISNVYPGPQEDFIPRKFTIDDNYNQSLAQLGFVVINVAYRGSSPIRGKAFHCFGYGNLRDYALADDKFVIEQLADRYAFIDLNRVGIYGHSGGGMMSTAAMLTYPDFYKVAVSASGNHDNNIYTQWWGETYHGITMKTQQRGDSSIYKFETKIPTNTELAANLKGKLFLITGDVDKNVHPASTLRLVDALIKANKRFDMMILPGKDHGLGDKYYTNLIRYYFVENLLGQPQQDRDIIKHE
ncbi:S9 family peptidase [Chitinophaga defluvii]|uniref:DPP IV N-terminal domain-containing protein n=1 Tax=Chitinophaga defluvii TaxID=3163343 RepID=A0ABV2T850_9BACT